MEEIEITFNHFQIVDGAIEFVAYNSAGNIGVYYSAEWVADNVGDDASVADAQQFIEENKEFVDVAIVGKLRASPELGNPLGELPYAAFARAPFHQIEMRYAHAN